MHQNVIRKEVAVSDRMVELRQSGGFVNSYAVRVWSGNQVDDVILGLDARAAWRRFYLIVRIMGGGNV